MIKLLLICIFLLIASLVLGILTCCYPQKASFGIALSSVIVIGEIYWILLVGDAAYLFITWILSKLF